MVRSLVEHVQHLTTIVLVKCHDLHELSWHSVLLFVTSR